MSLNPVRILKAEADEEKAETARLSSFIGAMAVGDLVKSTLGPKGNAKKSGHGRSENFKKSRPKNSWNQMNQFQNIFPMKIKILLPENGK